MFQVSATFAASLVTSPAIGAYLSANYGDNLVVLVATLVALADICFILLAVPESLPDKMRLNTWGAPISWEQADPFAVNPIFCSTCYSLADNNPFFPVVTSHMIRALSKHYVVFDRIALS